MTERDIELLSDLFLHRMATAEQFIALGYYSSIQRCNTRCRQLFDSGLLLRHRLPITGSTTGTILYSVAAAAATIIATQIDWDVAEVRRLTRTEYVPLSVQHMLRVVDIRIIVQKSSVDRGFEVQWLPELQCHHAYSIRFQNQLEPTREVFKPDGYFCISPSAACPLHLFLECDMGTTSQQRWLKRFQLYNQYAATGLLKSRYSTDSYLVLIVTTSLRRVDHLRQLAEEAKFFGALITTFQKLGSEGPFAPVWFSAASREPRTLTSYDHDRRSR